MIVTVLLVLVLVALTAGVLFSLARPRDEDAAFIESGRSHLSGERPPLDPRHRR